MIQSPIIMTVKVEEFVKYRCIHERCLLYKSEYKLFLRNKIPENIARAHSKLFA